MNAVAECTERGRTVKREELVCQEEEKCGAVRSFLLELDNVEWGFPRWGDAQAESLCPDQMLGS